MIRKTKKGPRRLREVPVVSRIEAVHTTYTKCEYITAGKIYERNLHSKWSFGITDDTGDEICICRPEGACGHLGRVGVWKYVRIVK
jgi:hypothetical protein